MKYKFEIGCVVAVLILFALTRVVDNAFYFFAGFVVLQYVVMATAWNILGGYGGYVNFGSAGFLAVGAYSAVALINFFSDGDSFFASMMSSIIVQILVGGLVAALLGLFTGYLTLRLRGVFFAIATLALAIVLETFVANWEFVGGAAGISILPKREPSLFGVIIIDRKEGIFATWKEFLFLLMGIIAVIAVFTARFIERSKLGRGLKALKDNEEAAECMGVPTLRLKLAATTISGFFMGVAGAPLVSYLTFIDPLSAFNLEYAVYALAMPMVGGTLSWLGPVIGAVLLGTAQQVAVVTISSELNLLLVGVVLIVVVIAAPGGILGWIKKAR